MKKLKPLLGLSMGLMCASALSGCSSEPMVTLHVLNAEDYICEGKDAEIYYDVDEDGEDEVYNSVLTVFEKVEGRKLGKKVKVIYDCYDTNETMLSSLKTGKSHYDLVCCSDYTVQKMAMNGLLQPIPKESVANYYGDEETAGYAPSFLREKMQGIEAPLPDGTKAILDDYTVGYMWGTLGIVYNSAKIAKDKGLDEARVHSDMREWANCWDPVYYGEMSVKDSMRDTYSMGIMKLFDKEIRDKLTASGFFDEDFFLKQEGTLEENYDAYLKAVEGYGPTITEIFNRCDKDTVTEVEKVLLSLKENVFGFEVDSGKEDIQKGLVGMNLAWSGDATYAITHARNQWNTTLNYSIPKTGGNIWFDSWTLTKEAKQPEMALDFLNFFCDPAIAAANQDYVGYTSFIAGENCRDVLIETHDARMHAMFEWDKKGEWYRYPETYIDPETGEEVTKDEPAYNEDYGYVYNPHFVGSDLDVCIYDGVEYEGGWDQYAEDHGWNVVNLEYFFKMDDVYEGFGINPDDEEAEPSVDFYGESPLDNPYLVFSDEKVVEYQGESFVAGGALYAQYPPQTIVPKLAIMRDYGPDNSNVLTMWENVKSNNLPIAGVVVFGIILAAAAGLIIAGLITKRRYHVIKVARRKETARK